MKTRGAITRLGLAGRRKLGPTFILLLLVPLFSGCYKVSARSGALPHPGPEKTTGVHLIVGLTTVNVVASECAHGFSRIETKRPWWDMVLLTPLTLGLVSASSVKYQCAAPARTTLREPVPTNPKERAPAPAVPWGEAP
jgi:hypothetical protein